ncbi:Peptidase propeptide and YPEB domain-containing protein [Allopseudospirillum japonicum]|uniref:Peptidase propeptide and YPEB domain-containing protein n=1 Tax=Allopseudospirillum japonicum TaxID=64971 RepID=A0A1H6RR95_9GAMM|nr:PepSY domain-containing protein [Allopseudospirillum japonicum]SEI55037.1 Peptidase propeptide and YPEB domain-containing protein [Allopseudospirillum japonicum]
MPAFYFYLIAGLLWPGLTLYADDIPVTQIQTWIQQGKLTPLETLRALHPQTLAGYLLDAELEYKDGHLVYELEILGTDSIVREFYLDAKDGTVLHQEIED